MPKKEKNSLHGLEKIYKSHLFAALYWTLFSGGTLDSHGPPAGSPFRGGDVYRVEGYKCNNPHILRIPGKSAPRKNNKEAIKKIQVRNENNNRTLSGLSKTRGITGA